jgi:hypothetical protein
MNKIEQEAEKYADLMDIRGSSMHRGLRSGFIAGAHYGIRSAKTEVHNAALSEAIEKFTVYKSWLTPGEVIEILEGLKIKP